MFLIKLGLIKSCDHNYLLLCIFTFSLLQNDSYEGMFLSAKKCKLDVSETQRS